jgi:hypothetical protein
MHGEGPGSTCLHWATRGGLMSWAKPRGLSRWVVAASRREPPSVSDTVCSPRPAAECPCGLSDSFLPYCTACQSLLLLHGTLTGISRNQHVEEQGMQEHRRRLHALHALAG